MKTISPFFLFYLRFIIAISYGIFGKISLMEKIKPSDPFPNLLYETFKVKISNI